MELKLSDSFEDPKGGAIEVVATMLNINYGHNRELMEQCRPLREYASFIQMTRNYEKQGLSIDEAVDHAVQYGIEQNFFDGYLKRHRAEVTSVFLAEEWERKKEWIMQDLEREQREMTYEDIAREARLDALAAARYEAREQVREQVREESLAEGRAEGLAEGRAEEAKRIFSVLSESGLSDEFIQSIKTKVASYH